MCHCCVWDQTSIKHQFSSNLWKSMMFDICWCLMFVDVWGLFILRCLFRVETMPRLPSDGLVLTGKWWDWMWSAVVLGPRIRSAGSAQIFGRYVIRWKLEVSFLVFLYVGYNMIRTNRTNSIAYGIEWLVLWQVMGVQSMCPECRFLHAAWASPCWTRLQGWVVSQRRLLNHFGVAAVLTYFPGGRIFA